MIPVIFGVALFAIVANLLLVILWNFNFKKYKKTNQRPFVSILVAARNEEENIRDCIESLLLQSYPKHKYEILIGDDDSDDNTWSISNEYATNNENIRVLRIKKNLGKAKGKANVLAHLARSSQGDVYLITDADIRAGKRWVEGMVEKLGPETGIINGFTVVEGNLMQRYEWAHALGMVKVLNDLGESVTGIGNNMLVTKQAYASVGGYESISFSLTEDYALYKQVVKKGFETKNVLSETTTAVSEPKNGLLGLLQQRKRWMTGAVQLPWYVVAILLLLGIYYPAIITLFYFMPLTAMYVFLVKLIFQSLFIKQVLNRSKSKTKGGFLIFELYAGFMAILAMVYYLIPGKIEWKGRSYDKSG